MMAKRSRALICLAALALGLMYVLPVWTIDLEAPQYPEGLGMVIQLNTIEGKKRHDLDNINNLNHYIGMQRIVPESIPELDLMPMIVAVLMVSGVLVAAVGRRRLLYAWTIAFLAISAVGMADFWKWEYDYGHNLDQENAIIKIPGMSYQPPLIGSRQILNFTAHSWPGAGGWIAILAAMTAVGVTLSERRRAHGLATASGSTPQAGDEPIMGDGGDPADGAEGTNQPVEGDDVTGEAHAAEDDSGEGPRVSRAVTTVALLLWSVACGSPEPRPLIAGSDGCAGCLMIVDGGGHGAELVSRTGRIYTFDSVECLVNYLASDEVDGVHSLWVTDFSDPDALVPAEEAFYLVSETLGSPMGLGITAFEREVDRDGAVHAFGGEPLGWAGVRALVAGAWPNGRPVRPHGGHSETLAPGGA